MKKQNWSNWTTFEPGSPNDNAFFSAPEPKTPPKKLDGKRLALVALCLLILAILGNFARQPVAGLIEYLMLPAETKAAMQEEEVPGVTALRPQGYAICGLGIESKTGKAVVELAGRGPYYRDLATFSSDNHRIEKRITDAFYDNWPDRYDEQADLKAFVFLSEFSIVRFGSAPTDEEIVAAVQPFLPKLESLRNALFNNGNEK